MDSLGPTPQATPRFDQSVRLTYFMHHQLFPVLLVVSTTYPVFAATDAPYAARGLCVQGKMQSLYVPVSGLPISMRCTLSRNNPGVLPAC